jgi:hypothetical protein
MPVSDNPFRNRVKLDAENMKVIVEVVKKDDESIVETGEFEAGKVHANLRNNIVLYGLSKLLQDRTSETPTGPGKVAAMRELMAQFEAGTWSAERKAGAPVVSPEVEAIAQLKGCTVAEAQKALRSHPQEVRDKIYANPKVKEIADQIRAARENATAVGLDDLAAA